MVYTALAKGGPKVAAKKGRKLDFAALAEELQVHITAFDAALRNVKHEERETEQALTKRDAAVAAFEPVYTGIAEQPAAADSASHRCPRGRHDPDPFDARQRRG